MLLGENLRDPILINTTGHTAGLLLFGLIIILFIRDRRSHGIRRTKLSILAAFLAFSWNAGSLIALAPGSGTLISFETVMTVNFSILSLLPAVLLHVTLRDRQKALTKAGYAISATAVLLHCGELFLNGPNFHQWAIILMAGGFGVLTAAAFFSTREDSIAWPNRADRIALACLFLFTSSFIHFGYQHVGSPWSAEITWHHIGIPVALVVLLQDYRFLLLDTFIRFLMNSGLAAAYLAILLFLNQKFRLWGVVTSNMFLLGLALVAFCLSLILFAHIRNILQRWIGRVLFRRQSLQPRLASINRLSSSARSEEDLLLEAASEVAAHLRTDQFRVGTLTEQDSGRPAHRCNRLSCSENMPTRNFHGLKLRFHSVSRVVSRA